MPSRPPSVCLARTLSPQQFPAGCFEWLPDHGQRCACASEGERASLNVRLPRAVLAHQVAGLQSASESCNTGCTSTIPAAVRRVFVVWAAASDFISKQKQNKTKFLFALKDFWKVLLRVSWNPEALFSCHGHESRPASAGSQYSWR